MEYWTKDINSWGIFSGELYPRSSITIQKTVWMSSIEFPVHSMIYRWVNKFRTHGTLLNLNSKDTRQSHYGWPKSPRAPSKVAAVRDSVVCSPDKSLRRRSQELGINLESVRRILIADLNTWRHEETSDRVPLSKKLTKLTQCQTFLTMSDFRTRHIFCCQATSTLRITSFGVPHCLSTVCKDHYTPLSALLGLPSPNMASLDHSGSRTTTSSLWQSTLSDISRCFANSGQHLVDEEESSGSTSGSSRMVPLFTTQTNHWHGYNSVSWPADQPQVWPRMVATFTRFEFPRLLSVGIP